MGGCCEPETQAITWLLYHGSQAEFSVLRPMPSRILDGERAVFATPHRWMAILFSVRWTEDDFSEFGAQTDLNTGAKVWVLEEARRGAFEEIFVGHAWLYTLSAAGFHGDPRLGMPNDELINSDAVTPLYREQVDVRAELLASPLVLKRK